MSVSAVELPKLVWISISYFSINLILKIKGRQSPLELNFMENISYARFYHFLPINPITFFSDLGEAEEPSERKLKLKVLTFKCKEADDHSILKNCSRKIWIIVLQRSLMKINCIFFIFSQWYLQNYYFIQINTILHLNHFKEFPFSTYLTASTLRQ